MHVIRFPYDSPASLFRLYQENECDDEGYPFAWPAISERRRIETAHRCADCRLAYLEEGLALTVHHRNGRKEDCSRENLEAMCESDHMALHTPSYGRGGVRCPWCKKDKVKFWSKSWGHLSRHNRGWHRDRVSGLVQEEPGVDYERHEEYAERGEHNEGNQEPGWYADHLSKPTRMNGSTRPSRKHTGTRPPWAKWTRPERPA